MVAAKREIPHYSYVDEFDATALVQLRDSLKHDFAEAGIKLTYLAFVVKAVVAALKQVPIVNSSLDERSRRYRSACPLSYRRRRLDPGRPGSARSARRRRKRAGQIAAEIDRLSSQARAGKIQLADIQGGTFTVTSIGNVGGLFSTPIIHQPQVGILGVGQNDPAAGVRRRRQCAAGRDAVPVVFVRSSRRRRRRRGRLRQRGHPPTAKPSPAAAAGWRIEGVSGSTNNHQKAFGGY